MLQLMDCTIIERSASNVRDLTKRIIHVVENAPNQMQADV